MNDIIKLEDITSKEKVNKIIKRYEKSILDGEINPLKAAITLKAIEDFAKALRSNILIKDCILEELDKYPEKVVKFNGYSFTKKAVSTKYDFSKCNDTKLQSLKASVEIATERYKEREEFVKMCPPDGLTIADEITGEIVTIYPPVKIQEPGFSISYIEMT